MQAQVLQLYGITEAIEQASSLGIGTIAGIVAAATVCAVGIGLLVHRWRVRRHLQSEIQSIMCGSLTYRLSDILEAMTPSRCLLLPWSVNHSGVSEPLSLSQDDSISTRPVFGAMLSYSEAL